MPAENIVPCRGTFDYIVVGAGAAGSILAARLCEDPDVTVCLVEAGPADRHPFIHLPAGFTRLVDQPGYTWPFSTEPHEASGGRSIPLMQGRVLGGSSSINGMIVNRGQRRDFDDWHRNGAAGWSYADVLPYFRKLERAADPSSPYRGSEGPLRITTVDWANAACDAFIEGAQAAGLPFNPDYNGADQAGVCRTQQAIHRGRRMSAARAFLREAARRPNLQVMVHAAVTTLVFEGRRATGIRYRRRGGELSELRARREVILCAGALNTPRLLQVSGIGPPDVLHALGVAPVHPLPGVGQNLRDHFAARVVVRGTGFTSINQLARPPRLWAQLARWAAGRPSILGICPSPVHYFWKSHAGAKDIDLQGFFTPGSYKPGKGRQLDDFPGMTCVTWQHRPQSTGHVRARSPDLAEMPEIQPMYLTHPRDCEVMVAGLRLARALMGSSALSPFVQMEAAPGHEAMTDEALLDYARRTGSSVFHPVGTARMGRHDDRHSVVDTALKVHGMQGLRVVDASAMPEIPSANTCIATMMIAEKAADIIRGRPALRAPDGI